MPELSVLLCVRNGERTIGAAVRSTLVGLPRDAELVVLDDASTDGTVSEVERCRDRRIVLRQAGTNLGASMARQALLAGTDSRLVATMDSDDVALPWRFRASAWAMKRARADLVFTQVVPFADNGRIRPLRPALPITALPETVPLLQLIGNNLYHPTLFARREALESLGGYRDCVAEDYDLWMRAVIAGKRIVRWGGHGLAYREHAGQVSKAPDFVRRTEELGLLAQTRSELRAQFGLSADQPPSATDLWDLLVREAEARGLSRAQWLVVTQLAKAYVGPPATA